MYSDAAGHTCSVAAPGYIYGPYLRTIPMEPITNDSSVTIATTAAANASTTSTKGWRFVNTTGVFQIHSINKARDGTTLLNAK